ncbi:MAG: prepilin-type N-terminal cleavage/methylation domain-containing protein [candidate division WOR-3 bacterium]
MRITLHPTFDTARRDGFTLMELLVVLLIIGVLSTVAIRTIDATRDRALFDQTTAEMKQLVYAVTGNPDILSDGRRVDFGFFGDMGRLPEELRELVENTTGSPHWRGPYFRRSLTGDSLGYLYDAWGNPYTYDKGSGVISTVGNGKYPMTMKVADDLGQLYDNSIVGQVSDPDGNPPGGSSVRVVLTTSYGTYSKYKVVNPGGDYEFSLAKGDSVPLGTHRLVAFLGTTDSIVRWVTVAPRSRNVVDFRFSRPFVSQLRMVGQPRIPLGVPDSSGFEFDIVSNYLQSVTVDSFVVDYVSDSVYFRTLQIDHTMQAGYPRPNDSLIGPGLATARIVPGVTIAPNMTQTVTIGLYEFATTRAGTDTANIHDKTFRIRFSEGSVITVKP